MKRRLAVALVVGLGLACGPGCGSGWDTQPARAVIAPPPVPWTQAPDLELDLRAWLSAEKAALLEPVTLVVDLFCGPGIECDFLPAVPTGFRGEVKAGQFEPLGAGRSRRFTLELVPVQKGDLEVVPFRAEAKLPARADAPVDSAAKPAEAKPVVATTPALKLSVGSVLAGQGEAFEPPAPPFDPRFNWVPWSIGAGAALLCALLIAWWRRRPKPARQAAMETRLPAHVTALRALARLRGAERAAAEQVDAFYVEVSRILRAYLEERFGLRAPERTTEEFLAELNRAGDGGPLDGRQRNALAGFLRQCDLVKFAGMTPGEDVHAESLRTAEEFVEATRADRMPEPRAAAAAPRPQPQEVAS